MLCMRKQRPFPGRLPLQKQRFIRPGHRARECRAAAPTCSQSSHPNTGQFSTLSAAVYGLDDSGTYHVVGTQYPFLVDTGAVISLIPSTVAKEALLKVDQRLPRRPIMVDGSSSCCEGTASTDLDVGPSRTPSTLYVVPNIQRGILGMDILSTLNLQLIPVPKGSLSTARKYRDPRGTKPDPNGILQSGSSSMAKCTPRPKKPFPQGKTQFGATSEPPRRAIGQALWSFLKP